MAKKRPSIQFLESRLLFAVHNDSFDVTHLTQLRSDATYSSITGTGIGIAVLDTGVDVANPDLANKVKAFYNAVENPVPSTISSSSASSATDADGHGTHTSGTAASADPTIGVAYGAALVDVKVIADSGESQLSGDPLLRGLQFVANFASQFNIKVVSMSLGEATSSGGVNDNSVPASDDISREISLLQSMGITVVSAAGNSYANDPTTGESYPAIVSTIAVGSTWADSGTGYDFNTYAYGSAYDSYAAYEKSAAVDRLSATSQRSTLGNMVLAPGVDIYSDWNGSSTDNSGNDLLHNTLSGTSMATPFVSGLVALMQQAAFTYGGRYITSPEQVLNIIRATADPVTDSTVTDNGRIQISNGAQVGSATYDLPETGDVYYRVNVFKAIQAVQQLFTGTVSNADTDNTTATATTVPVIDGTAIRYESGSIGTDGLNQVGANDVDLYALNLSSPGSLTVALADPSGGTAFAAELRLFNSAGGQISAAAGAAGSYPTLTLGSTTPLAAGLYYVGVSSAGNAAYVPTDGSNATGGSTTGDYALTLSLTNPDPNGVAQGAVSVDLTNPNYEFSNHTVANQYNGTLGSDPPPSGGSTRISVPNGDVDMFAVVAPDTGVLTAQVSATNYGFNGADSYVQAFSIDSAGNVSVVASDGVAANFASDSSITLDVTVGHTYYVAVTTYSNRTFSQTNPYNRVTNSTATQTSYDLYLSFDNGNTNGTALLATSATIGSTVSGAIQSTNATLGSNGGSKYVNWYTYTVGSDGLLDLTANATSSGFNPNVQLWTLSANGSSITQVGGITGSGQSLIDQLPAGTTVYVSVTGAGNTNFNWYSLGGGSGGQTGSYSVVSSLLPVSSLTTLNDNSVDYGTPGTITLGTPVSGDVGVDAGLLVGSTDVDLYKFTPTVTGLYDLRADTSQEGSADTVLRLFNSGGTQLLLNDNASSATTGSFIRASLTAGQTYYLGVSGTGNSTYNPVTDANTAAGSTGTYVLSVSSATLPAIAITSPPAVQPTAGSITFTVTLDEPAATDVTVNYATADGTAVAGTDYTATAGTLTFTPGQTSATITVPILVDASATTTVSFGLNLTGPSGNAVLDGGSATGTITNLPVTTYTLGGKARAVYLDGSGNRVTVVLTGPGTGTVAVVGSASGADATAVKITLSGTTNHSQLKFATGRNAVTNIDGIAVDGSLGTLAGNRVQLTGDLTVTGTIGTLILFGAAGDHTLSVQGTTAIGALQLGNVTDLNVAVAEPLKLLQANVWQNLSNADTISIPSATTIKVTGDFGPSLNVPGSVANVRVGRSITGGRWSIGGSLGSVVTGGTGLAWSANVVGAIGSFVVNGDGSGNLSAGSINAIHVRDNATSFNVTTTGAGTRYSIGSYTVGANLNGSSIRAAGTVNSIRGGSFSDSLIYAGVSSASTGLITTAGSFTAAAAINSFTVTGVRGAATLFSDTTVAASALGHVTVSRVNESNAGSPFGFSADTLTTFTEVEPATKTLRWNDRLPVSDLTFPGDFRVDLL